MCNTNSAHCVPDARVRSLSPQTWFQENQAGKLIASYDKTELISPSNQVMEFPHHGYSNLPLMCADHRPEVGFSVHDKCLSTNRKISTSRVPDRQTPVLRRVVCPAWDSLAYNLSVCLQTRIACALLCNLFDTTTSRHLGLDSCRFEVCCEVPGPK